ncbi:hypothetical protein ACHHYP_03872 [Achlya hypogyna]|uniref:Hyaluronan/mRNA-binding protein domain-containing protein n=1 Tax=Achlya hypogyna TaxID=1202772 RepID=A0A1V9ZQ85_ACHHY|nr:hypothetical protein ACHHYP_03872 [Achlya hypogyna]
MPQSRELLSKKNANKDRQSRGPAGSGSLDAKKHGAGSHNWGTAIDDYHHAGSDVLDRADPNYDSSEEDSK